MVEEKEKETGYEYTNTIPFSSPVGKQLVILQQIELHTLRKWNLIRYRFALVKKAMYFMQIAHSSESLEEKSSHAFLSILTFAMSMDVPEKDRRFRQLFNYLTFGSQEYYEKIVDFVLESPRREWVRLAKILDLLGDAVPESRVKDVIDWYLRLEANPIDKRWGKVSYLKSITSIVRYSSDAEYWIDRLIDLCRNTRHDFSKEFYDFVIDKGSREQILHIWNTRLEQLDQEKTRSDQSEQSQSKNIASETAAGTKRFEVTTDIIPEVPKTIIWKFGFEIIRKRADMRKELRSWMEANCPDNANDKHNLAQVLNSNSEMESEKTRNQIIEKIKKSFENPSSFNSIQFQLYGDLNWSNEQVLPVLDLIESNIKTGSLYPEHLSSLFAVLTLFIEDSDEQRRIRLSEICNYVLNLKRLPMKSIPKKEKFLSFFFNNDQPERVERYLLLLSHSGI